MRLVVDTNRIVAAVLRDGATRRLLRSDACEFCTVTQVLVSLAKHKEEFCRRSGLSWQEIDIVIADVLSDMDIYCHRQYVDVMPDAETALSSVDPEDVPFLALALAKKFDIWSDDKHLECQHVVKVWKTTELVAHIA